MADTRVPDLLGVAQGDRNREWLLQALQVAVELELSTLPPYLCGLWSIKDQTPDKGPPPNAFSLILSVVFEEMVHMGLACNMLSTIGGTPHIVVPSYPGPLPGGVRPGVTVYLSGLTPDLVRDVYLQIEMPESPVPIEMSVTANTEESEHEQLDTTETTYKTIGDFYDAIHKAFAQAPESIITGERQLSTTFSDQENEAVYPINTKADAQKAIREIKEQGEGTSRTPEAVGYRELAHFYRFGEIYEGKTLKKVGSDEWAYDGDSIAFPDCWPMAKVPAGGYPPAVTGTFDGLFTSVLANLEAAWMEGGPVGQSFLQNGISVMFELGAEAVTLMQKQNPSGGNYGPDFLMASASAG
jgi:hypothetical protein